MANEPACAGSDVSRTETIGGSYSPPSEDATRSQTSVAFTERLPYTVTPPSGVGVGVAVGASVGVAVTAGDSVGVAVGDAGPAPALGEGFALGALQPAITRSPTVRRVAAAWRLTATTAVAGARPSVPRTPVSN
ncbi:hypothetical protein JCM18549_13890 [Halolamina salina]